MDVNQNVSSTQPVASSNGEDLLTHYKKCVFLENNSSGGVSGYS